MDNNSKSMPERCKKNGVSSKQAYLLDFTQFMNSHREGIASGWELDNRAGDLKTTLGCNETLVDNKTDAKSRMIRYFNPITDDKIEMRTCLKYNDGFDGNALEFSDASGLPVYRLVNQNGAFCIEGKNGALTPIYKPSETLTDFYFRIVVDLSKGTSFTVIDNIPYGEYPLLGKCVSSFAYSTGIETVSNISLSSSIMFANFAVREDFSFCDGKLPYDMTATGKVCVENVNPSYPIATGEAVLYPGSLLSKCFEPMESELIFKFNTYLPNGTDNVRYALYAGGKEAVAVTVNEGMLCTDNNKKSFMNKLWYKLYMRVNPTAGTAEIKINGKIIETVALKVNGPIDEVRFLNNGSTNVKIDDIAVYAYSDYDIPEPIIPEGADKYTLGINVCSLWRNGDHFGWATITPYDDLMPVLGYYDEGLPETADWENKFFAEHGIDFQAFCWYGSKNRKPFKATPLSTHLDEGYMHSKYSDKVKFCLLWETANPADNPADLDAFKEYFVPYWIENYFTDERYMTLTDGTEEKLLFSIYACDAANGIIDALGDDGFTQALAYLRDEVKKATGYGMIITASAGHRNDLEKYGFDGWQAYHWNGSGETLQGNINSMIKAKNDKDVYAIPTVSVGINSVGWTTIRTPMITLEDYKAAHEWVRDTYLPQNSDSESWKNNLVWISTWNEYGEGTYIMPAEGHYGFGYLDVLRSVYTTANKIHEDVIPNQEQRARINHLYPQDRRLLRANGKYKPDLSANTEINCIDLSVPGNFGKYLAFDDIKPSFTTDAQGTTMTSVTTDPKLIFSESMYKELSCEELDAIRITATGELKDVMQLFFKTDAAQDLCEQNSLLAKRTDENGACIYTFLMKKHSRWTGAIKHLRLDPTSVADKTFTIKKIEIISFRLPKLFVNNRPMKNVIYPEKKDGVWYFPFEPGKSLIHFALGIYYEWKHDIKALKLHLGDRCVTLTVGSNMADVNGNEFIMDGKVYLTDNIPMLPIESLANVLGYRCTKNGDDYIIWTE